MKEIQTKAYQTSDGKIFTDKQDAFKHELLIVCLEEMSKGGDIVTAQALQEIMIQNADKLAHLLSGLTK